MSVPYTTFSTKIFASNPEVDCPAQTKPKEKINLRFNRKARISKLEERRQGIVAAVGPIACEFCDIKCKDAYIGLAKEDTVDNLTRQGVKLAETPVELPFRSASQTVDVVIENKPQKKAEKKAERPKPIELGAKKSGFRLSPPNKAEFGGWKAKTMNQIADYAIALHAATVVTPNPDGGLELHDFFQDELTYGPQATPEQPTTPAEVFDINPDIHISDLDGQHRIF